MPRSRRKQNQSKPDVALSQSAFAKRPKLTSARYRWTTGSTEAELYAFPGLFVALSANPPVWNVQTSCLSMSGGEYGAFFHFGPHAKGSAAGAGRWVVCSLWVSGWINGSPTYERSSDTSVSCLVMNGPHCCKRGGGVGCLLGRWGWCSGMRVSACACADFHIHPNMCKGHGEQHSCMFY